MQIEKPLSKDEELCADLFEMVMQKYFDKYYDPEEMSEDDFSVLNSGIIMSFLEEINAADKFSQQFLLHLYLNERYEA